MIGLTMAADGLTPVITMQSGYCGWVYGGRLSLLTGDWGGDDNSVFVNGRFSDDNILVTELYAGIELARRCGNATVRGLWRDRNAKLAERRARSKCGRRIHRIHWPRATNRRRFLVRACHPERSEGSTCAFAESSSMRRRPSRTGRPPRRLWRINACQFAHQIRFDTLRSELGRQLHEHRQPRSEPTVPTSPDSVRTHSPGSKVMMW